MRSGRGATLPLQSESIKVLIDHQVAESHIEHRFHNVASVRAEGLYELDLGPRANVSGFSYWNGESKIVGEVFETDLARAIYGTVVSYQRDPGLLEKVGEGRFSLRVFPIEPNEVKRIAIDAVQWLSRSEDSVELRLPVTHEAANIAVTIRDPRPIGAVTSPSHEIEIAPRDKPVTEGKPVTIKARGRGKHAELVLRYELRDAPGSIAASLHRDPDQAAFVLLTLRPPRVTGRKETDVTLAIDRSGSMGGDPIERAREAARAIMGELEKSDRLNVIAFANHPASLYAAPQPLSDEVRSEALAFIERIRADEFGTNFADAISRAFRQQHADERVKSIVLLSDGDSTSSKPALTMVRAHPSTARLFALGIGEWVDRGALSALAQAKGGDALLLGPGATSAETAAELAARLSRPSALENPTIAVTGVENAAFLPAKLPRVLAGSELVLIGRIADKGKANITLKGTSGDRKVAFDKSVDLDAKATRPWLGRMWAQARIDDLAVRITMEDAVARGGTIADLQEELIELALAYDVVTEHTSFLAIPESELTAWSRGAITNAREEKRKLMRAHPEAGSVSRREMPPGDPILRVKAPRDALHVTAFFPFGLVEELSFSSHDADWRTRFLVPKDVADGDYDVLIVVRNADGTTSKMLVPYTIDSSVSEVDVGVVAERGRIRMRVGSKEPLREVRVTLASSPAAPPITLRDNGSHLQFEGAMALRPGRHRLRFVASDMALNERVDVVTVEVKP
jgi:Ca-activated chloride channel family protein